MRAAISAGSCARLWFMRSPIHRSPLSSPCGRHAPHARRRRLRLKGPYGRGRLGDRGLDPPAPGRRTPPRLRHALLWWFGAWRRFGRWHAGSRALVGRVGGQVGGCPRCRPTRCPGFGRTRFGQISSRLCPRHGSHRQSSFAFALGLDSGTHCGTGRLGADQGFKRLWRPQNSRRRSVPAEQQGDVPVGEQP